MEWNLGGKNEIFFFFGLCFVGEAGAVLEIVLVWLELETRVCSGWVFLCCAAGLV